MKKYSTYTPHEIKLLTWRSQWWPLYKKKSQNDYVQQSWKKNWTDWKNVTVTYQYVHKYQHMFMIWNACNFCRIFTGTCCTSRNFLIESISNKISIISIFIHLVMGSLFWNIFWEVIWGYQMHSFDKIYVLQLIFFFSFVNDLRKYFRIFFTVRMGRCKFWENPLFYSLFL